jgi:hypothetical protein
MRQRCLLLLMAVLAFAPPLGAQNQPSPAGESAAASAPASDDSDAGEAASAEQGAAEAREAAGDDDFVPSEEVPPDQQVVFPVDI